MNARFARWPLFVSLLGYAVAANGILIIADTLHDQLVLRQASLHFRPGASVAFDVPLVAGLTLLYLSTLLRRRKRTAWAVTLFVYGVVLSFNLMHLALRTRAPAAQLAWEMVRGVALPAAIVAGLAATEKYFTVKSSVRSFAVSLRFVVLIMAVAFVYGVSGFLLMDKRDFHRELSVPAAAHYTIDQFGWTTATLTPHTRRARLFVTSLSVVSTVSVAYAFVSLFQPLKARLSDQSRGRERMRHLLAAHPASSEDFFKLWPHDKSYFFTPTHSAALAYSVHRGVALVVGGPAGDPVAFDRLLDGFDELCRTNDWATAFIYIASEQIELYRRHGFGVQKIGEEAVVDLAHFSEHVAGSKYFRQINNRFTKQGYTAELLRPPHSPALLRRLRSVSDDWLARPGRAERGFMLGYFNEEYLQQCELMVLRDASGTIQAFINQLPVFGGEEANFDLLRHTRGALGNANDFLLMQFIGHLRAQGYRRLNLGLCPLAGLDAHDEARGVIDSALRFLYANGDRLYSFSGLHRFKAKYEPVWSGRFIAYRGGVRGFTRILTALARAFRV